MCLIITSSWFYNLVTLLPFLCDVKFAHPKSLLLIKEMRSDIPNKLLYNTVTRLPL